MRSKTHRKSKPLISAVDKWLANGGGKNVRRQERRSNRRGARGSPQHLGEGRHTDKEGRDAEFGNQHESLRNFCRYVPERQQSER
jgi:hypothetical protein